MWCQFYCQYVWLFSEYCIYKTKCHPWLSAACESKNIKCFLKYLPTCSPNSKKLTVTGMANTFVVQIIADFHCKTVSPQEGMSWVPKHPFLLAFHTLPVPWPEMTVHLLLSASLPWRKERAKKANMLSVGQRRLMLQTTCISITLNTTIQATICLFAKKLRCLLQCTFN